MTAVWFVPEASARAISLAACSGSSSKCTPTNLDRRRCCLSAAVSAERSGTPYFSLASSRAASRASEDLRGFFCEVFLLRVGLGGLVGGGGSTGSSSYAWLSLEVLGSMIFTERPQ